MSHEVSGELSRARSAGRSRSYYNIINIIDLEPTCPAFWKAVSGLHPCTSKSCILKNGPYSENGPYFGGLHPR